MSESSMFSINVTREVSCPVDVVFRYLCDLRNDPEWWTGVREVRCTSDSPYMTGATYWQLNQLFGLRFPMDIEVTELLPNEKMVFRSVSDTLAPFVATYLFEPLPNGTRVTMLGNSRADGLVFRLMGALFRLLLRKYADRNFDRLERRLESLSAGEAEAAA